MPKRKGEAALDIWSLVHFVSGIALGGVGFGPFSGFGLLAVYEMVEALLRRGRSGRGLFEYESWANIVADLCFGVAGVLLAWSIRGGIGYGPLLP